MDKQTFEIDGAHFDSFEGFGKVFSRVCLNNYEWDGNLDAFNDILYGGFGTPDEGFRLVWKNSDQSLQNLGYSETVKWYEATLKTCHPLNVAALQQSMLLAKQSQGETLFDWIVEIIRSHNDIDLVLK